MTVFSSDYENQLFLPFVHYYLDHFGNPWDHFYRNGTHGGDDFPYQPAMLYVVALFCAPLQSLGWENIAARNFLFKLPTLIMDCAIACLLLRIFPGKWRQVLWFYFLSPIVLYACYMHSQLDLIPTACLFASFYFLRTNRWLPAFVLYGLALSTKLHVLVAFPLIAIYLYRKGKRQLVLNFAIVSLAIYVLIVAPYFNSSGFEHMVLANPKQSKVLEVNASIGDLKLSLPILATLIVFGRFALYPKINIDLLDAFLVLVFCALVMFIVPAPGWYVWMVPFISVFLIKHYDRNKHLVGPFLWLNFFYLVFFIFFHRPEYADLVLWDRPVEAKILQDSLRGFVFTLLEVGLLSNIVLCYRAGVRSNSIYKRDSAVVIGIGGDSGAGKSTLLGDIKQLLRTRVVEIEGDGDHKWERGDEHWQQFTHLDPKSNFLHRQADTILQLKRGRVVRRPEYDHHTGQFTSPRRIEPNEFIIMSGLHTFYLPKMRKLIDLKIFMDIEPDLHASWKVARDKEERGYSEKQVLDQIEKRRPDSSKFIAPQKGFADLVIQYFRYNSAPYDAQSQNVASADTVPQNDEGKLSLKVMLSSSISLENLVEALERAEVPVAWDYSEDLSRQEIILYRTVAPELLTSLSNETIPNLMDLIGGEPEWRDGYRGFVQLIVLTALSELMREREDVDAV
ncbi:MAG: hypothetical protein K2X93_13380 [Candidatus Obscuribacterales bacterium]|nr:hypothetical protein [Candidatus Obscuribacterales bacterium]